MEFDIYCQSILFENNNKIEVKYWSEDGEEIDEDGYDQYDPWEIAEQMEGIFHMTEIRINRHKEPTIYVLVNGKMAGAAFTEFKEKEMEGSQGQSFENDSEDEENVDETNPDIDEKRYIEYSFDIAVAPEFQNRNIGYILMRECMENGKNIKNEFGLPLLVRNWVVNRVAERLGEKLFGFEVVARHDGGSCHMEKWL